MESCEHWQELLSTRMDGQLTRQEEAELNAHLAECEECRSLLNLYQYLSDELRTEDAAPPETLIPGVMKRISAEKQKRHRHWIPIAAGAAACIAIVCMAAPSLGGGSSSSESAACTAEEYVGQADSAAEESIDTFSADASAESGNSVMAIYDPDAWKDDPILSQYYGEVELYGSMPDEILELGAEYLDTVNGQERYVLPASEEEALQQVLDETCAYCWLAGNPDGQELLLTAEPS